MKRRILVLLAVVGSTVVGPVPAADAGGAAACVITGTISFSPPTVAAATGEWNISPGAINCNGAINGYRVHGQGPFAGWGSYTTLPAGNGACLLHLGTGMVDYTIQTGAMVHHLQETTKFVMVGAGTFATQSLEGSVQLVPPYDGDCVNGPVTRALFSVQAAILWTAPFFLDDTRVPDGRS